MKKTVLSPAVAVFITFFHPVAVAPFAFRIRWGNGGIIGRAECGLQAGSLAYGAVQGAGLLVVYSCGVALSFALRRKEPTIQRSYWVAGYPVTSFVFLCG